ncbi:CheY-like chemotaxis protein [Ciceribacter lividus]|uniref:CheY-like chemotaxis protein n=1 Tax=Ciceribacter lividus TaxID=1197950 RepID=A0A6I7HQA9_9HYPH|nr:response regulator [Ciceribacter lividus]RCW27428.1 CheY-like chemotaxis protein [Ciceribacter lividus]
MKNFPAVPVESGSKGKHVTGEMAARDAQLHTAALDAASEALSAAIMIYDRNDELIYASRQMAGYVPVSPHFFSPGTRLREFLGAAYDAGMHSCTPAGGAAIGSREEWIAESIAAHWRERFDYQMRDAQRGWTKMSMRRLSSGHGLCVITDISEQKKREEQWHADLERVQLTEEILDNLPHPVFVQDRSLMIVAVNKAFCALFGARTDVMLGSSLNSLFDKALAASLGDTARHVLDTGAPSLVSVTVPQPSGPVALAVRSRRVGKPGRYFVVTSLDHPADMTLATERTATVAFGAEQQALVEDASDGHARALDLSGRRVLLVTADSAFADAALETLSELRLDACSVQNAGEEEAFLDVARSAGVAIDLVVVDTNMDVRCLELAHQHGVEALPIDSFQIRNELAALAAERLSRSPSVEDDDWEITTGDAVPMSSDPLVLVAEDNAINQIVFAQILEGLGFRFTIASSGEEAVRLWQNLEPQIVLMDVTLPGISGYDACRRIRDLDRASGRTTPVIGVLAHAFERDREDCLSAGMDDILQKPLCSDAIEAIFQRFIPGYIAFSPA